MGINWIRCQISLKLTFSARALSRHASQLVPHLQIWLTAGRKIVDCANQSIDKIVVLDFWLLCALLFPVLSDDVIKPNCFVWPNIELFRKVHPHPDWKEKTVLFDFELNICNTIYQPLDKPRNRQLWAVGSNEAKSKLGPSSLLSSVALRELRLKTFLEAAKSSQNWKTRKNCRKESKISQQGKTLEKYHKLQNKDKLQEIILARLRSLCVCWFECLRITL